MQYHNIWCNIKVNIQKLNTGLRDAVQGGLEDSCFFALSFKVEGVELGGPS